MRKAERRRVGSTEPLQHGEEARCAAGRQALDDGAHCVFLAERDDELVLHHAAVAVQAVPRSDEVEWMEEGAESLNLAGTRRSAPCGYQNSLKAATVA